MGFLHLGLVSNLKGNRWYTRPWLILNVPLVKWLTRCPFTAEARVRIPYGIHIVGWRRWYSRRAHNPRTQVRILPPLLKRSTVRYIKKVALAMLHGGRCPGGGIGRHAGLKILCLYGRAGSSPAPGTKRSGKAVVEK